MFSILLGIELGVELLGPVVTLCLTFWGSAKLFFRADAPSHILMGLLGWAPGKPPRALLLPPSLLGKVTYVWLEG